MSKMVTAAEQEKIMREGEEMMMKYDEAHGCGYDKIPVREADGIYKRVYNPVRPVPCIRDENGEIARQNIKRLFAKINEELDELKSEVDGWRWYIATDYRTQEKESEWKGSIAEEAADTITAITTLEEALGIDAKMRDEVQRLVNRKNLERGRL